MAIIANLLTEHMDIWTAAEFEKKSGRGNTSSNTSGVYGIKKLRELILELAISGKIVKSEESWKQTKLGDLGAWAIGGGFPTAEQGSQSGNILFAKVSDMNNIGNEKFIFHTNNTITEEVAKKLKANIHPAGTVIFPKIGGAIATNKRRILVKPTAIDNNCLGITPLNGVTTDWLYLILSTIDLSKYQAGTSVPALAQGVLQEIQVMLPSVAEQQRVVAKVDELMAICDQLEQQHSNAQETHETLVSQLLTTLTQSQNAAEFNANWQYIYAYFDVLFTTEASIDALKQTLLQLAVMGKLVPQDPNDEPASVLLKRIQAEKAKLIAEGKLKKEKPLAPISEDEKPFHLPEGWAFSYITQVVSNDKYSIKRGPFGSAIKKEYFVNEGFKVYEQQHAINDNFYLGHYYIDKTKFEELSAFEVKANDIIISCSGTVGRVAIAPSDMKAGIINQALLKITLNESALINTYFKILFPAFYMKTDKLSDLSGTAQKNIVSVDELKNEPFPLPPLAEQHRIVAKVDALMGQCDQLKIRIQQANQQQQAIADALVAQAVA